MFKKGSIFPHGHVFCVQYVIFRLEHILLCLIIFFSENVLLPLYRIYTELHCSWTIYWRINSCGSAKVYDAVSSLFL
jgi:hypothetical protein